MKTTSRVASIEDEQIGKPAKYLPQHDGNIMLYTQYIRKSILK